MAHLGKIGLKKKYFSSTFVKYADRSLGNHAKTTPIILNEMARNVKPISRPPVNETRQKTRIMWAEYHTKTIFKHILYTDEDKASLDGPDGWSKFGVLLELLFRIVIAANKGV